MSKKQVVAAAQNAKTTEAEVQVQTRWTVPENLKKVPYLQWPEADRKAYLAQNKKDIAARKAKIEAKWQELLAMLDGPALELAKSIHDKQGRAKANPAKDLFGKEPAVGDRVLFSMDKLKLVEKCQAKGFKLDIETGEEGAEVVLKALPKEEAAA